MYRIGQLRKFKPRREMYKKLSKVSVDSALYFRFRCMYDFRDTRYDGIYFYIVECDNVSKRIYEHHCSFKEEQPCGCGLCRSVRKNKPPRYEYKIRILGRENCIDEVDELTLWYFTEEVIC